MACRSRLLPSLRNILRSKLLRENLSVTRNYWQRKDVFSELSCAMQSMENRMRDMERDTSRIFNEFQRSSPVKLPRLFSFPFEQCRAKEVPVVTADGKSRTYRLELDMKGMEPEDINITLKGQELTVVARKEQKRSDGSSFARESCYQYTLPNEVNPDTIKSLLSDGVLVIEASLPPLESKEIPVKIETGTDPAQNSPSKE